MDFKLSPEKVRFRRSLDEALVRATRPAAHTELPPAGAAPPLGETLCPLAFGPELAFLFAGAARRAWASENGSASSGGLLDAVLACESAGRRPLERSARPIFLVAWLARHLGDGACLDGRLADTALAIEDGITEVLATRVRRRGEAWSLTGTFDLVEGGMAATHLLAAACPWPEGRGLFLVELEGPGVSRHPVRYLDVAQPAARIVLDDAPARPLGREVSHQLDGLGRIGRLLTAAELLGAASEIMDRTIGYARRREQFGKPLAAFQAVSHSCANLYRDVELMRSLVYAATGSPSDADVPSRAGAAEAKLLASELAGSVADRGMHLFGAEGLRWHRGLHLLVRRIKVLQVLFGDTDACEEAIISDWVSRSAPEAEGAHAPLRARLPEAIA